MISGNSAFVIPPMILLLAFLLDAAVGDPRWLPHPVRMIGRAINGIEKILRKYFKSPSQEKIGGAILVVVIVIPVFLITFFVCNAIRLFTDSPIHLIGIVLLIYLTATTIAVRELINSAQAVIKAVKDKDIKTARNSLSTIVGRDTENLNEEKILKATMESLAENLSDGVIAPVFYLVLGGLPLAMAYKAINTLDSMVGYKNEKYANFGWAAARLDDIANYIPARISGALIVLSSFLIRLFTDSPIHPFTSIKVIIRDGRKHTSPNAGIPEAAMAGALGVKFGGPSTYGGIVVDKPYIGIYTAGDHLIASEKAINVVVLSSMLSIGIAVVFLYLRSLL